MTMTTISDRVRRSLRERAPDMGLTREFYTDADICALDLEHIFAKVAADDDAAGRFSSPVFDRVAKRFARGEPNIRDRFL